MSRFALILPLCLVFASSLLGQQATQANSSLVLPDNFVRVTIGVGEDPSETPRNNKQYEEIRRLKGRVKTLESAVRQLQEEIYYLRYAKAPVVVAPPTQETKPSSWFCAITSRFDRTYTGKGSTQVEARATALSSCQQRDGMSCEEDKMRCEKE